LGLAISGLAHSVKAIDSAAKSWQGGHHSREAAVLRILVGRDKYAARCREQCAYGRLALRMVVFVGFAHGLIVR
jgi:hypothetical protein